MNTKRVAVFGDVHGRLDLLENLYSMLEWESLDEIRHSGDLIDRGPDPQGVIQFCREKGIKGVMGNHEGSMLERYLDRGIPPKAGEKVDTFHKLIGFPQEIAYMKALPYLHVDDQIQTVFVHGGVYPKLAWHEQPIPNVSFLSMVHPKFFGETRWFNTDKKGRSEDANRAEGWRRWYEVYDHEYRVVFGHTVFRRAPLIYKPAPNVGECIGVDTGAVWTGQLTAVVLPQLKIVSTPLIRDFTRTDGSTDPY